MQKNNNHLNIGTLAYVAEKLNPKEYCLIPKEIREHLEDCEICSLKVMELCELIEERSEITIKKVTKRNFYKYSSIAAILVAGISSVIAFTVHEKYQKLIKESNIENSNIEIVRKNQLLDSLGVLQLKYERETKSINSRLSNLQSEFDAQNRIVASLYESNEVFERAMNVSLRGGALELKQKIRPRYKLSSTILFDWERSYVDNLKVAVYNNKGLRVFSNLKIEPGFRLGLREFGFGTYYIQLFSENTLVNSSKVKVY